jgi:hypothetical protein
MWERIPREVELVSVAEGIKTGGFAEDRKLVSSWGLQPLSGPQPSRHLVPLWGFVRVGQVGRTEDPAP